jgi:hypothetical protein
MNNMAGEVNAGEVNMAGDAAPAGGGQITVVSRQEDDHVLVTLPLVGFPPGFRLRPGDRVVVAQDDENRLVVRPLVRAVTVQERPDESVEQLVAEGHTYTLGAGAVRDVREELGGPPYSAWVVDNASGERGQVIAFRPQR